MFSLRSVAAVSTLSASIGYLVGRDHYTAHAANAGESRTSDLISKNDSATLRGLRTEAYTVSTKNDTPTWYDYLPTPFTVSASSKPLERSALPSYGTVETINSVAKIMQFGYPSFDNIRSYEDFVVAYDRRNRTAHWVFERITSGNVEYGDGVKREKCNFNEDTSIHPFFRASNADYKNSGYDRGHLAAASNHRHSQKAMSQTFLLSNIAPQVGIGFNRGPWNNLEKYTRAIARNSRCVYVCSGPLYLPRKEADGKQYVRYEVIGQNNVAVPTHFFKVLVIEDAQGQFEMKSFVMPNQVLPEDVQLKTYLFPVESIERAAGFLLFDKIPKKQFKLINGAKPK